MTQKNHENLITEINLLNIVTMTNKESLIKAIEPFPVSTGEAFYFLNFGSVMIEIQAYFKLNQTFKKLFLYYFYSQN